MPAAASMTVHAFLSLSDSEVLASLVLAHSHAFHSLLSDQTQTWSDDLIHLRQALQTAVAQDARANEWTLVFEYTIPRKEHRADLVLLTQNTIVVIECKRTIRDTTMLQQAETYAL